jgi:predicted extracellular nuclease
VCSIVKAQSNQKLPDFSIMFYNVENLFDTIDDITKNDNEFLPQSSKKWNTYKYYRKLKNITQVIIAAGEWHNPDLIGLAEIENQQCVWALTHHTNLARLQYEFIHFDSPDDRGIDVALLYNPQTFTPITQRPITIKFPNSPQSKTRDILYVKGKMIKTSDTIHVFVCHFPSRRGGQAKSESKRTFVAQVLRNTIDSIQQKNPSANIAIVGDFNDFPTNKSIQNVLQASTQNLNCITCLTNIIDPKAEGTNKYKGIWNILDQGIVSNSILNRYSILNIVVQKDFLLTKESKTGEFTPFRTYSGPQYNGGFSDHLPIILQFFEKK